MKNGCVVCKKFATKWLEWIDSKGRLVGGVFCDGCFSKKKSELQVIK